MQADGEAHKGAAHKHLDGDHETSKSSQDPELYPSPARRYVLDFRAQKRVCVRARPTAALLRPRTEQQRARPFGSYKAVWFSPEHSLDLLRENRSQRRRRLVALPSVHARFDRQIGTYLDLLVKGLRPASYARRLAREPASFADRHCSSGTVRGASRRERLAL